MNTCKICGFTCRNLSLHLKNHDISPYEYHLKYISSKVPQCENCQKPLEFVKLSKPYGRFCSTVCRSSFVMTSLNNTEEFQQKALKGKLNAIETSPELKAKLSNNAYKNLEVLNSEEGLVKASERASDPVFQAQKNFTKLLRQDERKNRTTRTFYILDFGHFLKFGCTSDFKKRCNDYKRFEQVKFTCLHEFKGQNVSILELEKDLILASLNWRPNTKVLKFGWSECVSSEFKTEFLTKFYELSASVQRL